MTKKPTKKAAKRKSAATNATPKKEAVDKSWHARFLELLANSCNVTLSAKGAAIDRVTAWRHYKQFPDFAAAWDDAKEQAVEILEAEAWQRARKQSDTLMIFLLKAHKPERYQDRLNLRVERKNLDEMSDEELERYESELARRTGAGSGS